MRPLQLSSSRRRGELAACWPTSSPAGRALPTRLHYRHAARRRRSLREPGLLQQHRAHAGRARQARHRRAGHDHLSIRRRVRAAGRAACMPCGPAGLRLVRVCVRAPMKYLRKHCITASLTPQRSGSPRAAGYEPNPKLPSKTCRSSAQARGPADMRAGRRPRHVHGDACGGRRGRAGAPVLCRRLVSGRRAAGRVRFRAERAAAEGRAAGCARTRAAAPLAELRGSHPMACGVHAKSAGPLVLGCQQVVRSPSAQALPPCALRC